MKAVIFLQIFFVAMVYGIPAAFGAEGSATEILSSPEASPLEQYAAREVRRYVYLRTGWLLPVVEKMEGGEGAAIVIMNSERAEWAGRTVENFPCDEAADSTDQRIFREFLDKDVAGMEKGAFLLRTMTMPCRKRHCLFIVGSGDMDTLYGAYRFAELLGIRFYLHGDVVPDTRERLPLVFEVNERCAPLFPLRGIQPFHDFPEGPDWWTLEHYLSIVTQLPKMGMNFIGLHTYPLTEPTVWVGEREEVNEDGTVKKSYPAQYYNTALAVGYGYAVRPTSRYACGASQLFPRDGYGVDFLSSFTPRPGTDEDNNRVFNETGKVFNDVFSEARELGIKTCIGTETPLSIPKYILDKQVSPSGTVQAEGGSVARYGNPIANTEDDALYQSVRYNLSGYRFEVPDGRYTVTLKFSEVAYDTVGARVFDVLLQNKPVIEALDIFDRVGKNAALDFSFADVETENGLLSVTFRAVTEFPAIAAIAVEGKGVSLKVNCGGEAYEDWAADAGMEADPALVQKVYEGMFTRIMRTHPLDYYWFWTPENWTWEGATETQASRTVRDLAAARAAWEAVQAPFQLATCGWVLGPPFDRAYLDHFLPKEVSVSTINRQLGYEPVDAAFGEIEGRGKWVIPWVEDDPALASPQFWARRMRRDARSALEYGCDGLMGIFWRTRGIATTLACLARAGWNQEWPETGEMEGHYRLRDTEAGFPVYTAYAPGDIEGTEDDPLYRTTRLDAKAYVLSVPNGACTVTLHFCEGQHGPGARVFDVMLQDTLVMDDLDIAKEGGRNRAVVKVFKDIPVEDGRLRIGFKRERDWPAIAAIEAQCEDTVVKINCGGGTYQDFSADVPHRPEDPSALDFYTDWAAHEFGTSIGAEAGEIWHQIDGTFPRTSTWKDGPGNFLPDQRPWAEVQEEYAFVEKFEALRSRVRGKGNLDRFDYWLRTLAYLRATAKMNCMWGVFNHAMDEVKATPEEARSDAAREKALPARIALVKAVAEMYEQLLGTVSTYGELGTICNLEAHTFPAMLDQPAEELAGFLEEDLPREALLPDTYAGEMRVIVPAIRTSRHPGAPLNLEVLTLSPEPVAKVLLHWRVMGEGDYKVESFNLAGRGVYHGRFDSFPAKDDIEYYIEVIPANGLSTYWPATAPDINQTVVVHSMASAG